MVIRAAHGFEDSDQRSGLVVAVEDSLLLKEMIETSQPILVSDVRLDARFPHFLEPHYLTWLGIPLISKGQVVGVIALEKEEATLLLGRKYQGDDNLCRASSGGIGKRPAV